MNELTGIDRKMESENRNQFEKSLLEEINEHRNKSLMVCSLCYFACYLKNG